MHAKTQAFRIGGNFSGERRVIHFGHRAATNAEQKLRTMAAVGLGAANERNQMPIVIHCHRVIGADGSLTGFGGGLPAKRYLLSLESTEFQLH